MGESFSVYVVFERAPTTEELADALGELRGRVELTAHHGGDPDPAALSDEELAAALLADGPLRPTVAVEAGDVWTSAWVYPDGVPEDDGPGEFEGARSLPHLQLRTPDATFYPGTDEDAAAVIDRHRDLLALVADVYEAFAAVGRTPSFAYGPHPGTEEALHDPDRDVSLSEHGVLAGVPETAFWLQVYPPRLVERLGADRLLSAPAWHTERLADGAVLVAVYETPSLYTTVEHDPGDVAAHLGLAGD